MPTSIQYSDYAQAALAAYASGLVAGDDNTNQYIAPDRMSAPQAAKFDATWAVLQQSASNANGFSAVLLQRKDAQGNATGEKLLAIAGTDPSSPLDVITDIVNIAQYGTALGMPQYLSLDTFYAQLVSSGKLGATEQIVVTGHSLGGFLTQAFTARHSSVVSAAYTYNAPGFGSIEALLGFFGIADTSAAAKITNVHATDGPSFTAGLGWLLGSSQGVRIEDHTFNPLDNHSVVRLGDALAVYAAYASLMPSTSMSQIEQQIVAGGYRDRRLEEALDALRTVFIGSACNDVNKTPTGDRTRFYSHLYALQNDAAFKSMAGQVQLVQAGVGFASLAASSTNVALAYRYALLELLPFAVVADTDAKNQMLYGAYSQRLSLFDDVTGQGELSAQWLSDRATMLDVLVKANTRNERFVNDSKLSEVTVYEDKTSGALLLLQPGSGPAPTRFVSFGGESADALSGGIRADHLYGGAGNDVLNGLGGADSLEGNADNDTLDGGPGNDTLIGGAGADTYVVGSSSDTDYVITSDAADRLVLAGRVLTGAGTVQAITDGVSVWIDTSVPTAVVLYMLDTAHAELTIAGSGSTVIVRAFADGDLGIAVPGASAPPVAPALPGSGATGTSRSTTYRETAHTVIDAFSLGAFTTTASGSYGEVWGNDKLLGNASDDVLLLGGEDAFGGGVDNDQGRRLTANDACFWREQRA